MNPASISKYLEIFRLSPECLQALSMLDSADEKTLLDEFRQDQLRLICDEQTKKTEVTIERFIGDSLRPEGHNAGVQKGYYDPVRPLALRRWSGLLFVLALGGAMAGLSYLKQQEKILKGSDSFGLHQIQNAMLTFSRFAPPIRELRSAAIIRELHPNNFCHVNRTFLGPSKPTAVCSTALPRSLAGQSRTIAIYIRLLYFDSTTAGVLEGFEIETFCPRTCLLYGSLG
jgi:hypothetical protein